MSFSNFISERITLPLGDLITGQTISSKLKFLQESQFWSKKQIAQFQDERLKKLIKHSYDTVPYYRDLFIHLKLKPSDIQTRKDLRKIPILTKSDIKKHGIDKFTSKIFSAKKCLNKSSSGSTGEPLFYYTTKDAYSLNLAANLRGWGWMGFRLGDKYIKLSQNPRKNPIKRIQDKFSNNLYLATNPLIDGNFQFILEQIEKYKPKIIRCYPDPLLFLARYKKQNPHFTYSPLAITTTGNTLFPETRKEIEEAFACKIFDSYSCEGNSNVFECPSHNCYHSAEEYGISEVLDKNGNNINKGIGRLISTDLWNLAHPFIRYDTQDFVEIDDEPCKCKRNLFKINRIIGRDNEVLEMESGRKFIVHNFTGFFQTDHTLINRSIEQFQVIKKKDGKILFRLVVNYKYSETTENYIRSFWENELKTSVLIEKLNQISLSSNGKRKFIINE